jgi:hypothetical protein
MDPIFFEGPHEDEGEASDDFSVEAGCQNLMYLLEPQNTEEQPEQRLEEGMRTSLEVEESMDRNHVELVSEERPGHVIIPESSTEQSAVVDEKRNGKRKKMDDKIPLPNLPAATQQTLRDICSHNLLHRCETQEASQEEKHFFVVRMENRLERDFSKQDAAELIKKLHRLVKTLRDYDTPFIPTKELPPELDPGKDRDARKRVRSNIDRCNIANAELYHRDMGKLQGSVNDAVDVLVDMMLK